jgi:hypothetical protein
MVSMVVEAAVTRKSRQKALIFMSTANDNRQSFCRPFLPFGLVILLLCRFFGGPVPVSHAGGDAPSIPDTPECAKISFKLTPKQLSISLWADKVVASRVDNTAPRQNSHDLDTLYGEAAVADQYLKRITRQVAASTGGTAVFPPGGGLKGRKRAEEKIQVELGGDASLLMDISRSSIEYDSIDQVYQALQFILQHGYKVVRLKDRARVPLASGFWDIHLNLRMPNDHIVELQLHLRKIRRYSISEGHRYYVRIREIKSRAFRENRPLTPDEKFTIDRLNCEQRRFYEKMFKQGRKGSK